MKRGHSLILGAAAALSTLGPLAGGAAAQEATTATRMLTSLDVARIRSVDDVAVRPDGSAIAYTLSVPREPGRDEDGSAWSELHVVDFTGANPRPFVTGPVNVSQPRWTPDGAYLSYLARREGDEARSLYVIPADAGDSRRLFQHETAIETLDWRPDGRAIAFIAESAVPADLQRQRELGFKQEIYEEDYPARQLFVLELPEGAAGSPGAVRRIDGLPGHAWHVEWSPDGERLLVDLSPTPLIDDRYMLRRLHVIDAASGDVLARIDNPGKLGDFAWSPDGDAIVMISGVDIHDPREGRLLVTAAAEGATLRDLLPDLQGHVEAFAFAGGGRIVYLASVGVGTRIGGVDVDGRGHEVLYDGSKPVYSDLDVDRAGRRLALVGESPSRPAEVFAAPVRRTARAERLTDVNPWLAQVRLGRQEIVRWRARDGLEIEGLLIHPVERAGDERVPTILVAHGGPESHYSNEWLTSYSMPGQLAAGRGYAVLYPNYRGSTGRGVEFAKADQGDAMGAEFEDVLAGIDHLVERGLADPDRIGITGGSYGGYFTAWAATRHSRRFAAGVMSVGISDQLSKTLTSDIPQELELVHWLTNPFEDLQLFLDRSPVLYVDSARTPLLIMHGKEDTRVFPGQSLELYRGLKMRTDVPVRLVFYPGEGHGNRKAAARYDFNLRMMRWFDHFLKRGAEELPPWRLEYGLEGAVSTEPE